MSAQRLTQALEHGNPRFADVVDHLHAFALSVRDHLAVEDPLAVSINADVVPTPWRDTWVAGLTSFEQLRDDWRRFLVEWDEQAIRDDLAAFRIEALMVCARITERVEFETRTFYSVALQLGRVRLSD